MIILKENIEITKSTRMMSNIISHPRDANQNHNEISCREIAHNEITTPRRFTTF